MLKMYEIKDVKEIEENNREIVNRAKQHLKEGFLKESKVLFELSLEICREQGWDGGVNYSMKMIKEIDERLNPFNELIKAEVIQPIGMPLPRKIKNSGVMVNLGTEDYPFTVTDIENNLMKRFESETGKHAFFRGKITQNYLKWKGFYANSFGEL